MFTWLTGKQVLKNETKDEDYEKYMLEHGGASRVKRVGKNKIVYFDADGKKQTVDKAAILQKMATQSATDTIANRMSNVNSAIDSAARGIASTLTEKGGVSVNAKDAVNRLFADANGRKMLKGDIDAMNKLSDDELRTVYSGLSDNEKKAFGDETAFLNQIKSATS
jgi:hypothetical protein